MYYYASELAIGLNGTTYYYDAQGNPTANSDWNGANISFNLLGGSLSLSGAKVYTNRNNGSDYIDTDNTQTLYYAIYKSGASVPSFTAAQILAGSSSGASTTYLGNDNFSGQNYSLNVNWGSSITESGDWKIRLYYYGNASYDSGGKQQYYPMDNYSNNGGSDYIANVSSYYGATAAGTQSSAFTGTGWFNLNSSGNTYTLNQANTYTGETQIDAGTLALSGSLSSSSAVYIGSGSVNQNAALALSGTTTLGSSVTANTGSGTRTLSKSDATSQTLSGALTLNNALSVDVSNASGTLTLSGVISGANSFTKTGSGVLTLSGSAANTFSSGTVSVSAGTLVLAKTTGAAIAGRPVTIASGATLKLDGASQISSAPLITVNTGSTFDLNGNNAEVAITGGGTINLNGASSSATLTANVGGTDTFSGTITDGSRTDGALTKTGNGTLTLSGANSYEGATSINAGAVSVGNNTGLGTGSGSTTVASGAALELYNNISSSEGLVIRGSGISGAGKAALWSSSGANTNSGSISIDGSADTVNQIGAASSATLQVGDVSTSSGKELWVVGSGNTTIAGTYTSANSFVKTNTGSVTLLGNNSSLTGNTYIREGTVVMSNNNALGVGRTIDLGATEGSAAATLRIGKDIINSNAISVASGSSGAKTLSYQSDTGTGKQLGGITLANSSLAYNIATGGTVLFGGGVTASTTSSDVNRLAVDGGGTLVVTNAGNVASSSDRYQVRIGNGTLVIGEGSIISRTGTAGLGHGIDLGVDLNNAIVNATSTLYASNGVTVANSIYVSTTNSSSRVIGLSGTGAATFSGDIGLASAGLTATAPTDGKVTFSGAITNFSGTTANTLTKAGNGTVTLSGVNTYGGTTTLSAGILQGGNNNAFGSGTLALNGGTIASDSSTGRTFNNALTIGGNVTIGQSSGGTGVLTFSGNASLGSSTRILDVIQEATLSGIVSGTGGLTKSGAGTLILSGANTFSGALSITDGKIQISSINNSNVAGVLGQGVNDITLGASGTTGILHYVGTGSTASSDKMFALASGGAGAIGVSNATTALTLSGLISGSGALDKRGEGTLVLSGNNTFSGALTIADGTLSVATFNNASANGPLGNSTGAVNLGKSGNTAALLYTGATDSSTKPIALVSGGTNSIDVSGSTTALTLSGLLSDTGAFHKTGSGTLTLSHANTYSGGTTLSAGTLQLNSTTAAGTGHITQTSGSSVLQFNTTGTVANTMSIYNIATLTNVTLSGNQTLNNATFNIAADTTTIDSGDLSGTGGVTKTGTGTLVLTGSNTYTGAVDVQAGMLELASSSGQAAGTTSSVSVSSGAKLLISTSNQVNNSAGVTLSGGTIQFGNGVSETFAGLTLSGNSTLDFGTGTSGTMWFDGSYTSGGNTLSLLNMSSGEIWKINQNLSSTIALGPYAAGTQSFSGFSITSSGGFTSGWDGTSFTITAIPEPSTYAAAAGLITLLVWPMRKKLMAKLRV